MASRVIHRQGRVSAAKRARFQLAIRNLGYVPDGVARSLPRRRKEVIGLICIECLGRPPNVENKNLVYNHQVLRGVERRVSRLGWSASAWPGSGSGP